MKKDTLIITATTALTAAVGAWLLVSMIDLWLLRALFILSVVLLPVAFWGGWKIGHRDAHTFLEGINKGTGTVMNAGDKVANLRAAQMQAARNQTRGAGQPVALPDVTRLEIVNPQSGQGEVIDL